MGFALLLLGLLPLALLPDFLSEESDEEIVDPEEDDPSEVSMDFFDPDDENETEDVLLPTDGDDESSGSEDPDQSQILAPSIEDDVASVSETPENVLTPTDEIDADVIALNFEEVTGVGYAEIENFDAEFDSVHVTIGPESVEGEIDVSVSTSHNGTDADVYVEGVLVAVLKGAPDATIENVIAKTGTVNV